MSASGLGAEPPARYALPGGRIAVASPGLYLRSLAGAALWLGAAPMAARALGEIGAHELLRRLQREWARGVRRALGIRLSLEGLEHVDPRQVYVVAALHEGLTDAVALLHLPLRMRFAVRDEFWGWRLLGPALAATRQIAVRPERGAWSYRRLLRAARSAFAEGYSLVVFPQGTILGIETDFQAGAFRLARALGRPVLPVALTGSHRVWEHPFTPRLRHGQRVSLRVLPPVPAAEVRATDPEQLRRSVQRRLKDAARGGGMAPPRRFVPERDGYWDGYAFRIDPDFPEMAGEVARHRAEAATRAEALSLSA